MCVVARSIQLAGLSLIALCACAAVPDPLSTVRANMLLLLQVDGSVDANITQWLGVLQPNGAFSDINYSDPNVAWWPACYHTRRMWTMAAAFQSPASSFNGSSALLADTVAAYNFWLIHDFQNPNWWYNDIGVGQGVGPTTLLLQNVGVLQSNQSAVALRILSRSNAAGGTDANAVWEEGVQCYTAVIFSNATALATSTSLLWKAITLQESWNPSDTGIKPDRSFWMHGSQLYSGGYGHMYAAVLLTALAWTSGTPFAPPAAALHTMVDFLVDGSLQMMRFNGTTDGNFGTAMWDISTIGREISRPYGMDWNGGAGQMVTFQASALQAIADGVGYRAAELEAFATLLNGTAGVQALPVNSGFRVYPFSAYSTFSRDAYMATQRMASNVTQTIESINGENCQGIHLSDGALFIYQTGYEFANAFPAWDWQRIPGTTVSPYAAPDACGKWGSTTTESSFVGGVTDGFIGATSMVFVAPFGQGLQFTRTTAFFDDIIVVLTAGLQSSPPKTAPAIAATPWTTLQQRPLSSPVYFASRGVDKPLPAASNVTLTATDWWVWEGNVGYVFLDVAPTTSTNSARSHASVGVQYSVHVSNVVQSGTWQDIGEESGTVSVPMFALWLQHSAEANAPFTYVVVPGQSLTQFMTTLGTLLADLTIVSNSESAQAVAYNNSATGVPSMIVAVFPSQQVEVATPQPVHDIVGGWDVTISHSALLLVTQTENAVSFSLSNPTVNVAWDVNVSIDVQLTATANGCRDTNATQPWSLVVVDPPTNGTSTTIVCPIATS